MQRLNIPRGGRENPIHSADWNIEKLPTHKYKRCAIENK
jgi:hypothetical protein